MVYKNKRSLKNISNFMIRYDFIRTVTSPNVTLSNEYVVHENIQLLFIVSQTAFSE